MVKITFKAENGMCPKFVYKDTVWTILESYTTYELISRPNRVKDVHEFMHTKDVYRFLRNGSDLDNKAFPLRDYEKVKDATGKEWWYASNPYGRTWKHKLVEVVEPRYHGIMTDNYRDCLRLSKEYIQKKIDEEEQESTLFDFIGEEQ